MKSLSKVYLMVFLTYSKQIIARNPIIVLVLFSIFICNAQSEEVKSYNRITPVIEDTNIPCKVQVKTETGMITGGMAYFSLPEGESFVPGLLTVKDTIANKEYKIMEEFVADFSSNFLLIVMSPPGSLSKPDSFPNKEKMPPDGTEISVTYSYLPRCNNDDNSIISPVTLLKNVAKNWELIRDISASLMMSQDSKSEIMWDFVFKNPDKWKISNPNITIIVNGEKEISIPVGKPPEIEHLSDLYIGMALWWLPYRYQIDNFLKQHKVALGNDLNNGVVIECISTDRTRSFAPRSHILIDKENCYEKIVETYNNGGERNYRIEILDHKTIGNIRIPIKYKETYFFGDTEDPSGEIIPKHSEEYCFSLSNIRLNQGVSDEEFK